MSEKCEKCGAPMVEIRDPCGFVQFCHEVGGRLCLRRQLTQSEAGEAAEKVARLQAIVDRLPKTADGVSVLVRDVVWGECEVGDSECGQTPRAIVSAELRGWSDYSFPEGDWYLAGTEGFSGSEFSWNETDWYSTREAAAAAKEADDDA